ncbi:MAG TPA: DUF559 domain-containing protein [Rhizomicrobium sp.]|nr:DUF559 domain-containing protein [Rhizomicrobium sp.]
MSRSHGHDRAALKRGAARSLRSKSTEAERKLWHCLRDKRLCGFKFRRQQPIGPYIVDFYCSGAKLIVELDGSQHGDGRRPICDLQLTRWLETRGYAVIRFWNTDVLNDSDYALGCILHAIQKRQSEAR